MKTVTQISALLSLSLCWGLQGQTTQIHSPLAAKPAASAPAFPDEVDEWDRIIDLLRIICAILPCPHPVSNDLAEEADTLALERIDSYQTNGLKPNLSPTEVAVGGEAISEIIDWIDTHQGWLPETTEQDLMSMALDIQAELQ